MTFEKSNELYNIKRILGCVCKPIIKDIIAYDESTRVWSYFFPKFESNTDIDNGCNPTVMWL